VCICVCRMWFPQTSRVWSPRDQTARLTSLDFVVCRPPLTTQSPSRGLSTNVGLVSCVVACSYTFIQFCDTVGWVKWGQKKVKVAHTQLPSVGSWSWSRFLAVSLQVTWVINPVLGCHNFPPGLLLPPQPLRGLLPVLLLGEQRHNGCEQFA